MIRTFDVGPQLTLPLGPVRPHAGAAVGLAYTGTEGSVACRRRCRYEDDGERAEISFHYLPRLTYSLARTVGVAVQLTRRAAGRVPVWLDVRVSHQRNGRTRYAVKDVPEPVVGRTEDRLWQVGVTAGVR